MDLEELKRRLDDYQWYHEIQVTETLKTKTYMPQIRFIWDGILKFMQTIDFRDKRVLDVGCCDGLFSFEAEKRGAREVVGIENKLRPGPQELLIPHFKSKITMHQCNVNDLSPAMYGKFDIILCFGLLYHLRFPFWGLSRMLDCLNDKGLILIETALIAAGGRRELLYCPFDEGPCGATSPALFNVAGLTVTMHSLNCRLLRTEYISKAPSMIRRLKETLKILLSGSSLMRNRFPAVLRTILMFQKDNDLRESVVQDGAEAVSKRKIEGYWYGDANLSK